MSVIAWRRVFQAVMRGRRARGAIRVSCTFSAGLVAGLFGFFLLNLNPKGTGFLEQTYSLPEFRYWLVLIPAVMIISGVVMAAFMSWIMASAEAWLPVLVRYGRPGTVLATSLILTGLFMLLVPFLGFIIATVFTVLSSNSTGWIETLFYLSLSGSLFPMSGAVFPMLLLAVSLIWAWPLVSALLARFGRATRSENWVWLDPTPADMPLPPMRSYLRRVTIIGIAGGAIFGVVLSSLAACMPETWTQAITHGDDLKLDYTRMMLSAMLVQGLIAALTVLAVPRLRVVHALFAANIAALILAAAVWLHVLVQTGWTIPDFLHRFGVASPIVTGGMVVTFAVAFLLSPVAGLLWPRQNL